ncbi:hydroxysqualene dehydroxylase HpnE [Ottowia oryzae]|uniref:Desaturase n=1 Tax=Ottowia oryzae TaxID=2109914 RepID=A0A2S0MHF1_9BURK|nr:hydroxysqualene dehydroxylase HpnE [Ottowia oryzae]AVO35309.1 desaturase [Ottowia oryzae]
MAAAVRAQQAGHHVTVLEAARQLGGRARAMPLTLPDGRSVTVDNGQHILIGAYSESLRLMRQVGVDADQALLRLPLALTFPDGSGLALPDWPAPWDAAAGILRARGWGWRDKLSLLRAATAWQLGGFECDDQLSVGTLCAGLTPTLRDGFIEPLCVSALNTPMAQASARVFLRVLRDAMFGVRGGSNLLLPRVDLGTLFPESAGRWLAARGAQVRLAARVAALHKVGAQWQLAMGEGEGPARAEGFDQVVLATSAPHAAQLLSDCAQTAQAPLAKDLRRWSETANALRHEAITTVYALALAETGARTVSNNAASLGAPTPLLRAPMLALRAGPGAPAQFVFDRDTISPSPTPTMQPTRLLAFVISASQGDRAALEAAVTAQAERQLGLRIQPLRTVTDKRATFACTPGLRRPPSGVAPGLIAVGDYVEGPYPATLEGAVLSAQAVDFAEGGRSAA